LYCLPLASEGQGTPPKEDGKMKKYFFTRIILPLLFPKDIRCPHCGYKMEFVPKDPNQPWIMHNGYGCRHCGYYFITNTELR
jgi:DNA-directed RNA polymerase subunit RPC12/RpoP